MVVEFGKSSLPKAGAKSSLKRFSWARVRNFTFVLLGLTILLVAAISMESFDLLFAAKIAGVGVAVFLIGGAIFVLPWRRNRRRRLLQDLARNMGLKFSAEDCLGLPERFGSFGRQGNYRLRPEVRARNLLHGTYAGREAMAFDYGETSALIVPCQLPSMLIRPEDGIDTGASAVGLPDINFESHEFSSKFCVEAEDRKLAYDLIQPQMMEYLLAHPGWDLELAECGLLVTRTGLYEPWHSPDYREALDMATGFLDLIPRFVWKELGEGNEAARQANREASP